MNSTVRKNSYGIYEYQIDLTHSQLKGSIFSRNPIESWFSGISVEKDYDKVALAAYDRCRHDPECID